MFGELGSFSDGAESSGLPLLLTQGTTAAEITNSEAYPASSPITEILATVAAAAGKGVKKYLMLSVDSPSAQTIVALTAKFALKLGVTLTPLYYPADTTDFAPLAAQAAAAHRGAIGFIAATVVPLINALNAQGISPAQTPMFTAVSLMPPSVLQQLGAKLDGFYLVSTDWPAQDGTNSGIAKMLSEFKAAGITTSQADIGALSVDMWAKVHVLDSALVKLGKTADANLTSPQLVRAVVALGQVNRPEMAPFDFAQQAFPGTPGLSALRIFGRDVMVVQVEKSTYKPVSGFVDSTKPFKLNTAG